MMWPRINSEIQYGSLSKYLNATKNETGGFSDTKGRISAIGTFQLWTMIEKIKGGLVTNPYIGSTFNCEKSGGAVSDDIRTLEVIWSYGKTFLRDCAGIQAALSAEPKIAGRDLHNYQDLAVRLVRKGIRIAQLKAALIDFQPNVMRQADAAYESWVAWSGETFASEAQALITNPDSQQDLTKLRKLTKDRLDGSGFFKGASKDGRFKLYPKAKDSIPLLILSPKADVRISDDVKAKAEMFKSSVIFKEYYGSWSQTANRKTLTLFCSSELCTENLVREALTASGVERSFIIIEKESN